MNLTYTIYNSAGNILRAGLTWEEVAHAVKNGYRKTKGHNILITHDQPLEPEYPGISAERSRQYNDSMLGEL